MDNTAIIKASAALLIADAMSMDAAINIVDIHSSDDNHLIGSCVVLVGEDVCKAISDLIMSVVTAAKLPSPPKLVN